METTRFIIKQNPNTKEVEIELYRTMDDGSWMMFDRFAPISVKELKMLELKIHEIFSRTEEKHKHDMERS